MKRISLLAIVILALGAFSAAAGEGKGEACTADAQTCVNYIGQSASSQGWMGIDGEADKESGFYKVTGVTEDSPAMSAGFKSGYVVTAVNGMTVNVNDEAAMKEVMAVLVPDAKVTFTVEAGYGKSKDITVRLEAMPEDVLAKKLGKHMLTHVEVAANSSR